PHCQAATKVMNRLQQEYGPRGLQVIDVAVNQNADLLVENFAKDFQTNFPVGWTPSSEMLSFMGFSMAARYVVPQLVLIDRNGYIHYQTPATEDGRWERLPLRVRTRPLPAWRWRRRVRKIPLCARSSAWIERLPPEQKVRGSNPLGRTNFLKHEFRLSKNELQCELKDARLSGGEDPSEGGRRHGVARIVEVSMIQQVEEIRAKLQLLGFGLWSDGDGKGSDY